MKRIAVWFLTMALLAQTGSAVTWHKTILAAQNEAKARKQLIFVDMFAEWCGWCHKMEREVFPSEKFQHVTSDMVLLRVNIEDRAEGTRLAREFSATALPTFLILTSDLKLAGMIQGYAPATEFTNRLGEVRNAYESFKKKLKLAVANPKDHKLRVEIASEMNMRRTYAEAETELTKLLGEKSLVADLRDQAYYQLAVSQFSQKKYDASTVTLKKFASIQSKGEPFERSRLLLGDIYLNQGNYKGALAEFRSFKQKYPSSPFAKNVDSIMPQLERVVAASN